MSLIKKGGRSGILLLAMFSAFLLPQLTRADLLELTNGDHYRGTVVSMTASNVDFISEIQGRVTLPRSKVAQITLHAVVPKPVVMQPVANAPLILSGGSTTPPPDPAPVNVNVTTPPANNTQLVVAQLQQQGIDPKLINQIQEQIFGKASPEAAAKFNQMMGGLMSGQISVKDLRDQAQRAIDQIQAAKKDLGPDGAEMLDGYLSILQKFVQDAATDNTITSVTPTK